MQQLNLQLYARSKDGVFSEDLSVRRSVTLTSEPVKLELAIPAEGHGDIVELRLDPDDKPSIFVLHALAVRTTDGKALFAWNRKSEDLPNPVGLEAWEQDGQIVLEASTFDPFLLIPIAPPSPGVVLECTIGSVILADHPKELADAIRSLQYTLRAAIDDIASQQESLHEFVLLNQRHSTANLQAIYERIEGIAPLLSSSVDEARRDIMIAARDDWKSTRQRICEVSDAIRCNDAREASAADRLETDFAKLRQTVEKSASTQEVIKEVRYELGIRRDDDAIPAIQQLKSEVLALRARLKSIEHSFLWRVTHPFQ